MKKAILNFLTQKLSYSNNSISHNFPLKNQLFAPKAEKLLLDEFKAIYVVIPKTGCTSVKKFFSNYYGWNEVINVHNPSSEIYSHIINEDLTQEKYKNHFIFTFVRNPFSRLYSAYKSKIQTQGVKSPQWVDGVEIGLYKMGIRKEHSFSEFVTLVCNTPDQQCDPHVTSQWQFIRAKDGTFLTDKIYRFEQFQKDFVSLLTKLGIPLNLHKVPHENKSQIKQNQYIEFFDNQLISMVAERYKLDFDLLNYPPILSP